MYKVVVKFINGEIFRRECADLSTAIALYNELTECADLVRKSAMFDEDGERVDLDDLEDEDEGEYDDPYTEVGYDPYGGCYSYDC